MTYQEAFKIISETLRTDKDLYYAYQSNIAVQFQDEVRNAGYNFPDLHKLSNNAAKNFLDLLVTKGT